MRQWGAPEDEPIRSMQNNDVAKIRTNVFLKQAQKTGGPFWETRWAYIFGAAPDTTLSLFCW
ncbi:MAG: hypothetical protein Ct9H300mP11_21740 [Chloroflexota bacterium]|nr:MAG: hypothetical protein Ct9H300mP11_21740 [Chloroflexota bacterium]